MVALVRAWDRAERINIVRLSDPRAADLLAPMTETERMATIHSRSPDGTILDGGRAAVRLARGLPGLRRTAGMVENSALATGVLERGYRLIARNRHRLARFVPDRAAVSRWNG